MPYIVSVDDNFHYQDRSARYEAGRYEDAEEALAVCRRCVDDFLASTLTPGMSATALYTRYTMFGEDPYILAVDVPPLAFSAWDYAKERCAALCDG
jgi:hypothetical protein